MAGVGAVVEAAVGHKSLQVYKTNLRKSESADVYVLSRCSSYRCLRELKRLTSRYCYCPPVLVPTAVLWQVANRVLTVVVTLRRRGSNIGRRGWWRRRWGRRRRRRGRSVGVACSR